MLFAMFCVPQQAKQTVSWIQESGRAPSSPSRGRLACMGDATFLCRKLIRSSCCRHQTVRTAVPSTRVENPQTKTPRN